MSFSFLIQNVLPSTAIFVSVIFSLTEAEQFINLKSSKSAHQSSPSFSSSSPDVTRRSGYPSYDAFVDSRYEFPSPVSGADGDILESSDHSNVEDYTQPASNPSPVVVIPLKYGQRRQVKQHHSSSYCMYFMSIECFSWKTYKNSDIDLDLPKISQGYSSTRRPYDGEPAREFSDNNFRTFSDYFNNNYDQSREQQQHSEPNDGGWRGWRGIPTPGYGSSNRNNEMATTTSPPHHGDGDRYQANHYPSDPHVNEVPTHQTRHGWRPRNNNNQPRYLKRTVSRRPVQPDPEESNDQPPESSYEPQQQQKSFDHQLTPAYEPSKFWHPGVPGFDSMNQETSGNQEERSEEEDIDDQPPVPPRSPRGHQKMSKESGGGGRVQRGAIKPSESRAQGVIVTGKDLEAEAGQFHHCLIIVCTYNSF